MLPGGAARNLFALMKCSSHRLGLLALILVLSSCGIAIQGETRGEDAAPVDDAAIFGKESGETNEPNANNQPNEENQAPSGGAQNEDVPNLTSPPARSVCGNGAKEAAEECDGEPSCSVECERVVCGNGRRDEGEECDGEPTCSSRCLSAECGNLRLDGLEECEPPDVGSCGASCTIIECGNHRVDEGEECDPPLEGSCSTSCQKIFCGNGRRDEGEGCEPPGTTDCDPACRPKGCGNGVVEEERNEECDPPQSGSCDGECRTIRCGNSRIEDGEECEPPGTSTCDTKCVEIQCGNGRHDSSEECDPPALGACTERCETVSCGDGRHDPGEQCEPAIAGTDRCSEGCTTIHIGSATEYLYTFDHDAQKWYFYSASPDYLEMGARAVFDAQNGDVTPGALEISAPFDGSNQKIEVQVDFANFRDYGGRVLRARVRLESGLSHDTENPGGVKLFAKSGDDWAYASGNWGYLTPGATWVDLTLSLDHPTLQPNPGTFDASSVRQIGVEVRCFNETSQVSAAVMYLDSIGF